MRPGHLLILRDAAKWPLLRMRAPIETEESMADARRAQLKDQTDISGARALIVEARFYDDIQDALLEGAVAELKAAGVSHDVITVPGALEIPTAIAIAAGISSAPGTVMTSCVKPAAFNSATAPSISASWISS